MTSHMTPTQVLILQWLVTIGIGVIIISLVKYIFNRERGLMMTKEDHATVCVKAQKDLGVALREEFAAFKEHFDTEMELKVLRQLKDLNGTLEDKIENIVANQMKGLKSDIDTNTKLVEILKEVLRKQ